MKLTGTPTFVVTIPLLVKHGEDRTLIGCMEAGRRLYNATLGEALCRHGLLKQSKHWQCTRELKDRKDRSAEFKRLSKEAGFTPAAIITFARNCKNEAGWKDRLGSNVIQRIAKQVFAATQQYAFCKRGRPRFKGANRPLHWLEATTNAAKIIWKAETGCVAFGDMTIAALLPSKGQDPYLHQAQTGRTKYCGVVWPNVNGARRRSVQLMQEGIAPAKYEHVCGAVVGLDIGPSTIAVVGDESVSLMKFCDTVVQPWEPMRRLQCAMDRSKRATNPHRFSANGTWKKGQKFTPSKRYCEIRSKYAQVERKLAAERKRSHGEFANQIPGLGNVVRPETLSDRAFQRNYGKSVKVGVPGMLVERVRRKAESAGGKLADLKTWPLKMSQYDHITQVCANKPLKQRWHAPGDGSGVVQRDIYCAFLARRALDNKHRLFRLETMRAAQKPVLVRTGWLRHEPAKIEPSGKIRMATPSEPAVHNRGLAIGHRQDAVVARREPGDPDGFALRIPCL